MKSNLYAKRAIAGILSLLLVAVAAFGAFPASGVYAGETETGAVVIDEDGVTFDDPAAAAEDTEGAEAPAPEAAPVLTDADVQNAAAAEDEALATEASAGISALGAAAPVDQSKVVANSLDYVAAKYEGVGENSVFDIVTIERLNKNVLLKDGKSIIVLGSPRNATSQATLAAINEVAKANGIQKIYLFDTHLGGELGFDGSDITNPDALPALYAFWTALKTAVTTGTAAAQTAKLAYIDPSFTGDDTYLFVFDRKGGANTAETIVSDLLVKDAAAAADQAAFKAQVAQVLTDGLDGAAETRSTQYDYFSTAFSAASPKVDAFYGSAYYAANPDKFRLVSVSAPELIHIIQTQGTHNVLISGSWCPDSRAAIGYVSENATRYNSSPVYVWDWRIDGASSTTTYATSDTNGAKATAGWLDEKLIALLAPFDSGYENTFGYNFVDGNPSVDRVIRANRSFRSPSLYQISTQTGQKPSVVQNWVHYTQLYELPFHYTNSNKTDAGLPIDYELSSGYLTNAQKALGRAALGDFFSGTKVVTSKGSTSVGTTVSKDDSGCGDDNDPLDDIGGDTLIPYQGTKDYDVQHYDIKITYDPDAADAKATILGETTVKGVASKTIDTISLDFKPLVVNNSLVTLKIGGEAASIKSIVRENDDHADNNKIHIILNTPITAGTSFEVFIPYSTGILDNFVADAESPQGFFTRNDGKGIAAIGEPLGSVYWFPNNNTPYDGASYTITLVSPSAYTNVSNGVRTSNTTANAKRTTVWNVTQDTAPYQIFAYISNDVTEFSGTSSTSWPIKSSAVQQITVSDPSSESGTKVIPGLSYANKSIYDANASRNRDKIDTFFNRLPYYIGELEKIAGPYPGESAGFVFENLGNGLGESASWGAVETKDRPFFTTAGVTSENTFIHEFAHQWYGDAVRIAGWEDLWLNEGFATYVTDLYYENTQAGYLANTKYKAVYDRTLTTALREWWSYAPAKIEREGDLFGGASAAYNRGALALATLRVSVGDTDFFNILKGWPVAYKGQAATTADFIAYSEEISGRDLTAWANDWLYGQVKPAAWPTLIPAAPQDVTVSFDSAGGSAADSIIVTTGDPIGALPQPTKDGYTFDGWFVGDTQINSAYVVTGAVTLTAHWTEITVPENAYVTISGPAAVDEGDIAEYTIALGNAVNVSNLAITIENSANLEFKGATTADGSVLDYFYTVNHSDGSTTILLWAQKPGATISAAAGVVKLAFDAKSVGSANVTLKGATGTVFTYDGAVYTGAESLVIDIPEGEGATVVTVIAEKYDAFDFNRDGSVDLVDLAIAQGYYRASAEIGGADWAFVTERGIDVNHDGVVDVADFILIAAYIYK
ncbi:MAG: InlB B-repeat-containing protein [Clostridiales Family XIII bacterium]|jgi:uncharacterized repeat protein (TIGR02543 family)|nr:InlB B-repeat-containing protein [Clostridiales Family XIII bacterium]